MSGRVPAADLLATPGALLDRRALEELGLQRRSIDYVFQTLDVVALPGVRRVYVHADDYRRLIDQHTYTKNQVRPT